MPHYDFVCTKCDKTTEKFYPMNKAPQFIKCKCGRTMKRLLGAGSGILFKGENWTPKFYNRGGGKSE